jgi:hypothetical protein
LVIVKKIAATLNEIHNDNFVLPRPEHNIDFLTDFKLENFIIDIRDNEIIVTQIDVDDLIDGEGLNKDKIKLAKLQDVKSIQIHILNKFILLKNITVDGLEKELIVKLVKDNLFADEVVSLTDQILNLSINTNNHEATLASMRFYLDTKNPSFHNLLSDNVAHNVDANKEPTPSDINAQGIITYSVIDSRRNKKDYLIKDDFSESLYEPPEKILSTSSLKPNQGNSISQITPLQKNIKKPDNLQLSNGFFKRHSILKKVLIGAAIATSILLLLGIVVTAMAFSGGGAAALVAPLVIASLTTVKAFGVIGAVGAITGLTAATASLGGSVGFFVGTVQDDLNIENNESPQLVTTPQKKREGFNTVGIIRNAKKYNFDFFSNEKSQIFNEEEISVSKSQSVSKTIVAPSPNESKQNLGKRFR